MNISGIRPDNSFYNARVNRNNSIDEVSAKAEAVASSAENNKANANSVAATDSGIKDKSKPNFNSYDYAKGYDPSLEFSLKGSESELKNLDVVRAISDMEKDRAISQYQFFVGDKDYEPVSSELENFSL